MHSSFPNVGHPFFKTCVVVVLLSVVYRSCAEGSRRPGRILYGLNAHGEEDRHRPRRRGLQHPSEQWTNSSSGVLSLPLFQVFSDNEAGSRSCPFPRHSQAVS
jgi:hypothetical protein